MIGDVNAELAAYRNGELEMSQVPPGTEGAILEDSELGPQVVRSTPLFHDGLFFNTAEPPFDNVLARQAFATAIDRKSWIDKVRNGVGKPATGWLPPGMPGYDPQAGMEYAFDREAARQLLAQAGFPGARPFPRRP